MQRIAVLIPCLNEAAAIAGVVSGFRKCLPQAEIYVYDNGSTDHTGAIAREAGATVRREPVRGKGTVVQRMFREVDADVYVLVDGDGTYAPEDVHRLLGLLYQGADMAVGSRLMGSGKVHRPFHGFGNRAITSTINRLFGCCLTDVLSGYRAMTREFVKSVPVISSGFEIETELTLNALDGGFHIKEIGVSYGKRPNGSKSKLNTFRDGARIFFTIMGIFKDYRPLKCLGTLAVLSLVSGLVVGFPVLREFVATGYVQRVPSAILAASLEVLSFVLLGAGLILDTLARFRRQNQAMWRRLLS